MSSGKSAVARLQTRLDGLQRLGGDISGLTVAQAAEACRQVHADGARPESILIRQQFLRRESFLEIEGDHDRTPRRKPPLTTSIPGKGVPLKLELLLLFLAQCSKKPSRKGQVRYPVTRPYGSNEFGLTHFMATGTNRNNQGRKNKRSRKEMRAQQIRNALDRLAKPELQLVEIEELDGGKPDYDAGVILHIEVGPRPTGDQEPYQPPTGADRGRAVSIPIEFFTKGWLYVLTNSEIANWLMWRDVGNMRNAHTNAVSGLVIWADERLGWYDLTRDVWDTHLMLTEMGLMTVETADARREDGTVEGYRVTKDTAEPHLFGVTDDGLSQDAHTVLSAVVKRALGLAELSAALRAATRTTGAPGSAPSWPFT